MQTRASFILIFLFIMLSPMRVSSQIVTGAEQMDQYMPLLKGKRIGMVVNHRFTCIRVTAETMFGGKCFDYPDVSP